MRMTADAAGTHYILRYAVCLKEQMRLGIQSEIRSLEGMNEGQIIESSVKQTRQRLHHLAESRFLYKDSVQYSVPWVGRRILAYTAAGERPVADRHMIELGANHHGTIYR